MWWIFAVVYFENQLVNNPKILQKGCLNLTKYITVISGQEFDKISINGKWKSSEQKYDLFTNWVQFNNLTQTEMVSTTSCAMQPPTWRALSAIERAACCKQQLFWTRWKNWYYPCQSSKVKAAIGPTLPWTIRYAAGKVSAITGQAMEGGLGSK